MINIIRKEKEPSCLAIEKQKEIDKLKKKGDVNCGKDKENIKYKLKNDFLNKCFICESEGNTDFIIEHFIPHKQSKYIDLKFEWKNLFLACSYCNGKKSSVYNDCEENMILDCTNPNHDVENWINYRKSDELKSEFIISTKKKDKITLKTVEFLNKIYNGNEQTKENTENLNKKVYHELFYFRKAIDKFFAENNNERYLKRIKRKLSKKSSFTAFKRQIIKDKTEYSEKFKQYFD